MVKHVKRLAPFCLCLDKVKSGFQSKHPQKKEKAEVQNKQINNECRPTTLFQIGLPCLSFFMVLVPITIPLQFALIILLSFLLTAEQI